MNIAHLCHRCCYQEENVNSEIAILSFRVPNEWINKATTLPLVTLKSWTHSQDVLTSRLQLLQR